MKLIILYPTIGMCWRLNGGLRSPVISPAKPVRAARRLKGVTQAMFAVRFATWALGLTLLLSAAAFAVNADRVSESQKEAALEFLQAVASGDPEAVAAAIHPDELRALRLRILTALHNEAKKGDSTIHDRLFGPGKSLDEIEHLTDTGFYATLADRLFLPGREYDGGEGLASIADHDGKVQVVIRGRQPHDRGKVQVVNVVTLKPYGRDWKAALPSEIEAQIDDLIEGRHSTAATTHSAAAVRGGRATAPPPPGIVALLSSSQKLLEDGKCDDYYNKQMSPNFLRVTSKKALTTLISTCHNSMGTREMLLATLRVVRGLEPRYEFEGQRAIYDLAGAGLPFDHFVLEQVNKHWYVAE